MKRLLPFVLVLLASCEHPRSTFARKYHPSHTKKHNISEIATKVTDKVNEPQMQWVYYEGKMRAYLNIFVGELKTIADSKQVPVNIETDKGNFSFTATLLKGSQRVRIPDEVLPELLTLFENAKEATLSLSGYQTTVNLEQFKYMLDKSRKSHPLSSFKTTMIFDL
ncbi:MAG: hypothetical protein P0S95_04495 [Rhabdochlamydiaceae bacterium]|nr:hypothetical protein [Candidatus Amphrikana amoebophyrae]